MIVSPQVFLLIGILIMLSSIQKDDSNLSLLNEKTLKFPPQLPALSGVTEEVESDEVLRVKMAHCSKDISLDADEVIEFIDLCELGETQKACELISSSVLRSLDEDEKCDIPLRGRDWCREHMCVDNHHGRDCSVYKLDDWKFAHARNGKVSHNFLANGKKFIEGAIIALNITRGLNGYMGNILPPQFKRDMKKVMREVKGNPYVIYMTNMRDEQISDYKGEEKFFNCLYALRVRLGLNGDYGYRSLDSYKSETTELNAGLFERLKAWMPSMSESLKGGFRTIKNSLKSIIDKIFGLLTQAAVFVSESVTKILNYFKKWIQRAVWSLLMPEEWLKDIDTHGMKDSILLSVLIFILCIACLGGFIGAALCNTIFNALIYTGRKVAEFISEAEFDVISLVSGLCIYGYGLSKVDTKNVIDKCRMLMVSMAGGTILANSMASLFCLLPTVVRSSLVYRFGGEQARIKYEINEWRNMCLALISLSRTSTVVSSSYYASKVKEQMRIGSRLMKIINSKGFSEMRSLVVSVYFKLMAVYTVIVQRDFGGGSRPMPFVVHIAGIPGIGKTVSAEKLCRDAFDFEKPELYWKNMDTEFYDKYHGQPVILMDEFLLGDSISKIDLARHYLVLCSTATCMLPMASVDSPLVGLKGTTAEPKVVITLNNNPYDSIQEIDDDAFQRRRNCVIFAVKNLATAEDGRSMWRPMEGEPNKVDFDAYSDDELRDVAWARFRILPGQHNSRLPIDCSNMYKKYERNTKYPLVDYHTMVEIIREKYEHHMESCERLAKAMGGGISSRKSPEAMVDEVLREGFQLPTKPMSPQEAFGTLFGSMESEASPPRRPRHTHECCNRTIRHREVPPGAEPVFTCGICKQTQSCDSDKIKPILDEDPDQDYLANVGQEAGLDFSRTHRHRCIYSNCTRQYACKEENCAETDFCSEHKGKNKVAHKEVTITRFNPDLEVVITDITEYRQACFDVWLNNFDTVWCAFNPDRETFCNDMKNNFIGYIKTGFFISFLLTITTGLSYLLSGSEEQPETLTYSAESEPPKKESRSSRQLKGKFAKGVGSKSEAAPLIPMGQLTVVCKQQSFSAPCILIKDRWVLTFYHWLDRDEFDVNQVTNLLFSFKGQNFECEFSDRTLFSNLDCDLMLINLTNTKIPQFKDITNRFITDHEWKEMESFSCRMESPNKSVRYGTSILVTNATYHHNNRRVELDYAWKYSMLTNSGDCGLPLVVNSGPLINKICGLHVAGSGMKNHDPKGLATICVREFLNSVLLESDETGFISESTGVIYEDLPKEGLSNCVGLRKINLNERIYIPTNSKLRPSVLAPYLPWKTDKEPAIMSKYDERAEGQDPVLNAVYKTLTSEQVDIEEDALLEIEESVYERLKDNLTWPIGKRQLTFEEACEGVPGKLASVKTATNVGHPLCHSSRKRGKTDHVWFDKDGYMHYNPEFRRLVEQRIMDMDNYQGGTIDNVMPGYEKDELRRESKIKQKLTRITYANDFATCVAFRMKYGALVSAFNNSFQGTGYAIGINQYSKDMNAIYLRLVEVGKELIAGDFAEFDARFQHQFRKMAYNTLSRLSLLCNVSHSTNDYMYTHETGAWAQIGDVQYKTKSNNFSGCFWTTIVNCIVNEGYMRYAFMKLYPSRSFSESIRFVILGDDHILSKKKDLDLTPLKLGKVLSTIGQKYTSAFKDRELEDFCSDFKEVLFLGAHPREVNGIWTGALRKQTLEEGLLWTRDQDRTLDQSVVSFVECASQWDKEYFEYYKKTIQDAYEKIGRKFPSLPSYGELSRIVRNRSVLECEHFVSEGAKDPSAGGSRLVHGLTTINTGEFVGTAPYDPSNPTPLANLSINEEQMDINYGLQSLVKRDTITWNSSHALGTTLWTRHLPWELLSLGNTNNVQNMPFKNYIYFVTDVELVFQINGTPAQAGSVIVYFVPFSDTNPIFNNRSSYNSIYLAPNENTTRSLYVPFRFWRSAMNTFAGELSNETLGKVYVSVQSPLTSNAASSAYITVYSRFVAKFSIVRPIVTAAMLEEAEKRKLREDDSEFVSEGNTSSSQVTYNVGNVAGDMPSQATVSPNLSTNVDSSLVLPMDNPPCSGGSIPQHPVYSSMSKSNGVEPTVSMQFHQQMMNREQMKYTDPSETSIENLCGRRCYVFNFDWSDADVAGTVKIDMPLHSFFKTFVHNHDIGVNVAILNQFARWRADPVIEIFAVRNMFQSGRLLATVAYGAPSLSAGEENIFLNQVLEFNGDNNWASVRIRYNAATEFLRTYDGPGAPEFVQDHSLGQLRLSVANPLRVSSPIAASTIQVQVFVRFENIRVYEMKPQPLCRLGTYWDVPYITAASAKAEEFVSESDGPSPTSPSQGGVAQDKQQAGDDDTPTNMDTTASQSSVQPNIPCRLDLNRKFEYCITDVHEVVRRHIPFNFNYYSRAKLMTWYSTNYYVRLLPVIPLNPWCQVFAGWSGHLKYRIWIESSKPVFYGYYPTGADRQGGFFDPDQTIYGYSMAPGAISPSPWTGTSAISSHSGSSYSLPWEAAYPVSPGVWFIDVSIPFNSHLNWLPTIRGDNLGRNTNTSYNFLNGYLAVRTDEENPVTHAFQAAGDDFRFQIYRPLTSSAMRLYGGSGAYPVPGTDMAGNIY